MVVGCRVLLFVALGLFAVAGSGGAACDWLLLEASHRGAAAMKAFGHPAP